jgi:uncharacterized membrane protein
MGCMQRSSAMGHLEDAAGAYHAALARLDAARAAVPTARTEVEQARVELAAAIVDAARGGMAQIEIIRLTGYARESVRRILRNGGVEADE